MVVIKNMLQVFQIFFLFQANSSTNNLFCNRQKHNVNKVLFWCKIINIFLSLMWIIIHCFILTILFTNNAIHSRGVGVRVEIVEKH